MIKPWLLPLAILLLLGRGQAPPLWLALFALPTLVAAVLRYVTLHYRFEPDELVIREGVVSRQERHVPYARIQSIDTTQSVVHRALGVANVVIQTASGSAPEAVLRVLSHSAVAPMRARVFAGREAAAAKAPEAPEAVDRTTLADAPGPAEPDERLLVRLGLADLILHGATSNRGLVVVAAAAGLFSQYWEPESWLTPEQMAWASDTLEYWSFGQRVVLGFLLVAIGLALTRVLSVLLSLVTLFDFRLVRKGDQLRASYGLFTRHALTIPRHRIQLVELEASFLRRRLGRVTLRARTAGSAVAGERGGRRWLVPLLHERDLTALLAEIQPESRPAEVAWRPIHPRAGRRMLIRGGIRVALPATVLTVVLWPYGALAWPLLLGLVALYAWTVVRYTRWGLTDTGVWLRQGWLTRTARCVRYAKVRSVAHWTSPFDRRRRMAHVGVDTANSGLGSFAVAIPFLPADEAEAVRQRVQAEAARTEFRW